MVLIILATISIYAVLGDNGLIAKAQHAGEVHETGKVDEENRLDTLDEYIGNYMGGNGGEDAPTMPDGWDATKVTAVTSDDNVTVPVPIGYTASTVTGEKSVATGFVIKQGDNGAATSGINEFVWVPVDNISDLYDSTNNAGQLWDFSGTTSTKMDYPTTQNGGFREPDVVTSADSESDSSSGSSYDAVSSNLQQAGLSSTASAYYFKTQLQNEFTAMKNSVEKYGGFYIGRYETGNLSQSTAVVQKNNSDIASQTWYTTYKVSKTVKANDNVVSTMIWGCQWDATLRWMQTSSVEKVKNFATNSAAYGNFYNNSISYVKDGETLTTTEGTSSVIPTGSSETTNINNIYDMAGNVCDGSLEVVLYESGSRTTRGGNITSFFSSNSCDRNGWDPTQAGNALGSRAALYIAL